MTEKKKLTNKERLKKLREAAKNGKVEIASQKQIHDAPAGVDKIMEAIGHPEALVTDLSQVFDFIPWFPDHMVTETEKAEFKQMETDTLQRLSALLNREVKLIEHIWALANELEDQL